MGGARVSVCVSVCARGLHHRIPFTVPAGGHAHVGQFTSVELCLFPTFSRRCLVPDVTDNAFYVVRSEFCVVHRGETVTPWLWLWSL